MLLKISSLSTESGARFTISVDNYPENGNIVPFDGQLVRCLAGRELGSGTIHMPLHIRQSCLHNPIG